MTASVIDDSRSWMSDVAFRTAPPIGGLSCCYVVSSGETFRSHIAMANKITVDPESPTLVCHHSSIQTFATLAVFGLFAVLFIPLLPLDLPNSLIYQQDP